MPTPLPDSDHVLLVPPTTAEIDGISRSIRSAVATDGRLTDPQLLLLQASSPIDQLGGQRCTTGRTSSEPASGCLPCKHDYRSPS